jgi:hypothetical protein
VTDEYGQHWFVPDDVRKIAITILKRDAGGNNPRASDGDLHAYIFSRFMAEASLAQIVLETAQPVHVIKKLWEEFNHDLGDLPQREVTEAERLSLEKKRLENRRLKIRLDREDQRARERAHEARMSEIEDETRAIRKDREARQAREGSDTGKKEGKG